MVDGINLGESEVRTGSEAALDHEADLFHAEGRELLKSVVEQARAELTGDSEVSAQAVAEKVWTTLREKVGEVERQNPKVVLAAAESFIKDVDPQAFFNTKKPEVAWELMIVLYLALKNVESRLQVASKTKIEETPMAIKTKIETSTAASESVVPKKKLQIEIDRTKLEDKVAEITESYTFDLILHKAQEIKNRFKSESSKSNETPTTFDLEAETRELQQLVIEAIQALMSQSDLDNSSNSGSQDVVVDLAKAMSAAKNEVSRMKGSARMKEIDLKKMPTIDESLKSREVAKITDSDFFNDLAEKAKKLRRRSTEDTAEETVQTA